VDKEMLRLFIIGRTPQLSINLSRKSLTKDIPQLLSAMAIPVSDMRRLRSSISSYFPITVNRSVHVAIIPAKSTFTNGQKEI